MLSYEEGECSCGGGPFIDLRTQFARDLLEGTDERLKRKRERTHRFLSVVPALLSTILIAWLAPSLFEESQSEEISGELLIGVTVGLGLLYMAMFKILWPHRSRLDLLEKIPLEKE